MTRYRTITTKTSTNTVLCTLHTSSFRGRKFRVPPACVISYNLISRSMLRLKGIPKKNMHPSLSDIIMGGWKNILSTSIKNDVEMVIFGPFFFCALRFFIRSWGCGRLPMMCRRRGCAVKLMMRGQFVADDAVLRSTFIFVFFFFFSFASPRPKPDASSTGKTFDKRLLVAALKIATANATAAASYTATTSSCSDHRRSLSESIAHRKPSHLNTC